jgi:gamma-glutamyltranspeptidase/glutathione hydrolase
MLGTHGAVEGFYTGRIGEAICEAAREFDGVLDMHDLATHKTEFVEPVSVEYKGYRVYETPPPTHGIAALQALQMMEILDQRAEQSEQRVSCRGNPLLVHQEVECMRLAYADALTYVCDPRNAAVSFPPAMLCPEYAHSRAGLIKDSATSVTHGDLSPFLNSDTVYFCCADKDGNACSMINSNYMGFGTGISPVGCGFTLHNRGYNASLDPTHPNKLFPGKRPYHTIIPGLITESRTGDFFATFGNMGGFMQPMGHFQIVRNLIDYGLSPQEAVDAPRWYLTGKAF